MKFIDKLSHKRKRLVLGMIMMSMFIAVAQTLHFFAMACAEANYGGGVWIAFLLMLGIFWYLWLPPVICIILCYLILIRVLPYQEKDK